MARLRIVDEAFSRGGRGEGQVAALDDRAVEEPACRWRQQQGEHVRPASRLAEHRHVSGVAAERRRVVAHPFERAHLVERTEVARAVEIARPGVAQRRMPEPPEGSEAVVDRHDHHVLARRQVPAVEEAGMTDDVAAAVDPDHHRQAPGARRRGARRVHVQVEAVLGAGRRAPGQVFQAAEATRVLHARGCGGDRVTDTVPAGWRRRRPPALRADGRRRVRDAEPDRAAIPPDEPGDVAARGRAAERRIRRRTVGRGVARPARQQQTRDEESEQRQ